MFAYITKGKAAALLSLALIVVLFPDCSGCGHTQAFKYLASRSELQVQPKYIFVKNDSIKATVHIKTNNAYLRRGAKSLFQFYLESNLIAWDTLEHNNTPKYEYELVEKDLEISIPVLNNLSEDYGLIMFNIKVLNPKNGAYRETEKLCIVEVFADSASYNRIKSSK